ncbi:uncharacterized protein [Porites lutea]|uniref:uncharacterized protein n=1 Tax=Porites lutea TaxID=51062 RepID=UPI003CC5641D
MRIEGSSSQFQQCNHYTCQITEYQEDQYQYPLHEDNEERPYHRVIRSLRNLLNDIVDFTRLHYPTLRETSYPRLHIAICSPYNYRASPGNGWKGLNWVSDEL